MNSTNLFAHCGKLQVCDDGSFRWEGPLRKVGSGWGRLNQVFSGGDGIIYAITPSVPASLLTGIGPGFTGTPGSGGDLNVGSPRRSGEWHVPLGYAA